MRAMLGSENTKYTEKMTVGKETWDKERWELSVLILISTD